MELGLKPTNAIIVYEVSQEFWAQWRADKSSLKTAGYHVLKYKNTWFVLKST